jgi:DNA adenine methylase
MLNSILPILRTAPHKTYVEPFGGSAAVLVNKEPSPVEIYNDIYEEVVNFWRSLRDHKEELVGKIELTPYSRSEYEESLKNRPEDNIERARLFFVRARQVMMGLATTASPGRWCVASRQSRRGMALVVSRWLSATEGLLEIAERLRRVVIENDDAMRVIERYDDHNVLYYLDPTYPMDTRSGGRAYKHEFTESDHARLLDLVLNVKGKVALSSYDNGLYRSKLSSWTLHELGGGSHSARFHKGATLTRRECLWTNW